MGTCKCVQGMLGCVKSFLHLPNLILPNIILTAFSTESWTYSVCYASIIAHIWSFSMHQLARHCVDIHACSVDVCETKPY